MAIQYSGSTVINRVTTPSSRQDLVNFTTQAMFDAGMTTISGFPGSGADVTMETAVGNQGHKVRFRVLEPGSGTCAQFFMKNVGGNNVSQQFFASPTAPWRVMATKYHFFLMTAGPAFYLSGRSFVCGGLLYAPSFLTITDTCAFMQGNAVSDVDGANRSSFRNILRAYDNSNAGGRFSGLYNSNLVEASNYTTQAGNLNIGIWQAAPIN